MYKTNRVLFEVYETDEENYIPYEPFMGEKEVEEAEETTDEEVDEETIENNDEGFTIHMGEILKKFFYTNILSADFNSDYSDISESGNISLSFKETSLDECYLGVRCRISQDLIEDLTDFEIKEMSEAFLGFITDESFSDDTVKLGLSGMTKTLDKNYEFDFTQMLISEIIKEVILTAGLEPVVDFTGLQDQTIDFSTTSSSEESEASDDTSGIEASTNIKELAKKICKGKKKPLEKATALFNWMHNELNYEYYYNNRKTPEQVLASGGGNCVDHALLFAQMGRSQGLTVGFVNTTCNGYGHVYNLVKINGKVYPCDTSIKASVKAFGQTWGNCPSSASLWRNNWSG